MTLADCQKPLAPSARRWPRRMGWVAVPLGHVTMGAGTLRVLEVRAAAGGASLSWGGGAGGAGGGTMTGDTSTRNSIGSSSDVKVAAMVGSVAASDTPRETDVVAGVVTVCTPDESTPLVAGCTGAGMGRELDGGGGDGCGWGWG